jgi:succinate dehydrogenase/fumarate reductase cytochrome b subunit
LEFTHSFWDLGLLAIGIWAGPPNKSHKTVELERSMVDGLIRWYKAILLFHGLVGILKVCRLNMVRTTNYLNDTHITLSRPSNICPSKTININKHASFYHRITVMIIVIFYVFHSVAQDIYEVQLSISHKTVELERSMVDGLIRWYKAILLFHGLVRILKVCRMTWNMEQILQIDTPSLYRLIVVYLTIVSICIASSICL